MQFWELYVGFEVKNLGIRCLKWVFEVRSVN